MTTDRKIKIVFGLLFCGPFDNADYQAKNCPCWNDFIRTFFITNVTDLDFNRQLNIGSSFKTSI